MNAELDEDLDGYHNEEVDRFATPLISLKLTPGQYQFIRISNLATTDYETGLYFAGIFNT